MTTKLQNLCQRIPRECRYVLEQSRNFKYGSVPRDTIERRTHSATTVALRRLLSRDIQIFLGSNTTQHRFGSQPASADHEIEHDSEAVAAIQVGNLHDAVTLCRLVDLRHLLAAVGAAGYTR